MILADKIMVLRKQKGWSQEELAGKLDVSRQSVSKWESAASIPDLDKILGLSEIFGVSTDYLLKEAMEEEITVSPQTAGGEQEEALQSVSLGEATDYIELCRSQSRRSAFAIAAYVLSPELLIFLCGAAERSGGRLAEDRAGGIGIVVLLLIVAAATAVLILNNMRFEKYEYLKKEIFYLQYGVEGVVRKRKEEYAPVYGKYMAAGVACCILSAVPLMVAAMFDCSDMTYIVCVNILLLCVSVGVFLFVYSGIQWSAYQALLQEGDYTPENKAIEQSAVPVIYWGIVTAVYLGISFYTADWHKTWIVWPCTGVLYAAVQGAARALRRKGYKKIHK